MKHFGKLLNGVYCRMGQICHFVKTTAVEVMVTQRWVLEYTALAACDDRTGNTR